MNTEENLREVLPRIEKYVGGGKIRDLLDLKNGMKSVADMAKPNCIDKMGGVEKLLDKSAELSTTLASINGLHQKYNPTGYRCDIKTGEERVVIDELENLAQKVKEAQSECHKEIVKKLS